jgi:peptidoglycan/xylan/chitin deacetylase (PgdA/CDA1 family)
MSLILRRNLSLIRTKGIRRCEAAIAGIKFLKRQWVSELRSRQNMPGGVVVVYHRVNKSPGKKFKSTRNLSVETDQFEKQLLFLKENFTIVRLQTVVDCLRSQQELPRNFAAITFDDGYADNFTEAYPLLLKHKTPATIFLATGLIGSDDLFWHDKLEVILFRTRHRSLRFESHAGLDEIGLKTVGERYFAYEVLSERLLDLTPHERRMFLAELSIALDVEVSEETQKIYRPLDWEQVRRMFESGLVQFGGHSMNHQEITKLNWGIEAEELSLSRKLISRHIGVWPELFAYPNGTYDAGCHHRLAAYGYGGAFTTRLGVVNNGCSPFAIPRVGAAGMRVESLAIKIVSAMQMDKRNT